MATNDKNIYQRKNAVMKAIKYLQKDGTIQFGHQSYKAITHDAVIGALRPHLVEHGIDIGVTVTDHTLAGKVTIADVDMTLTNIDDPQDHVTYHGFAYGENGDKGPGSALSYAVKNLLLKAFAIETGENDESRFEIDEPVTAEQANELARLLDETGSDVAKFLAYFRVEDTTDLRPAQYEQALKMLQKKQAKEET